MSTIVKEELFKLDRANFILEHWEELEEEISTHCHTDTAGMKKQLRSFFDQHTNESNGIGTTVIKYNQKGPIGGRFFAEKLISLQGIARGIRQSIAEGIYVDVDISNAHPVILLELVRREVYGGAKLKFDALLHYVNNRDYVLEELIGALSTDREGAKKYMLKLTNKGEDSAINPDGTFVKYDKSTETGCNAFTKDYAAEMLKIHHHFASTRPKEYNKFVEYRKANGGNEWNKKAAFMNQLMCDAENQILQSMLRTFGDPINAVLCFDGALLPIANGPYDLERAERNILNETGFGVSLTIKPFDFVLNCFKNGNEIPPYKPPQIEFFNDYTHFTGEGKDVKLCNIMNWVSKVFMVIDSEGKKKIVRRKCRTEQVGPHIEQKPYYHIMDFDEAIKDMHVPLYILNDKYDQGFYDANKHLADSNPVWKNIKTKRHLEFNVRSDRKYDLGSFIKSCSDNNQIIKVNSVEFTPYTGEDPSAKLKQMNLFNGFSNDKKVPNPNIDFTKSHLYNLLLEVLCNGNKAELHHFLATIASKIQEPLIRYANAHVLASERGGVGKTLITSWLSLVFDKDKVTSISDISRYFEKFNSEYACKLIKVFEEVGSKAEFFEKFSERLKAEITEAKERVENKGKEAIQVNHCALFLLATNNVRNAIKYSDAGIKRRFTIHRMNCKYANQQWYFKPILEEINDPEFITASFHFFKHYKYDRDLVSINFETDANVAEKINQMPTGLKFIVDEIEEAFKDVDFIKEGPDSPLFRFPFAALNEKFKKEFNSRQETLKRQLEDIGIKEAVYRSHRNGSNAMRCVVLYPPTIQELIRKQIQTDAFTFNFTVIEDEKKEENFSRQELENQIQLLELQLKRLKDKLNEMN